MPGQSPTARASCALALCELLAGPFEVLRVVIAYEHLHAAAWAEEAGRALR